MTVIGHNSGAVDYSAIATEQARANLSPLQQRRADLLASFKRSPCGDDPQPVNRDTAAGVTNLIAKMAALLNAADNAHALAKEPWLEAGRAVDGERWDFRQDLEAARDKLLYSLNVWQLAEDHRVKQEREAEQAAFAAKGDPEPNFNPGPSMPKYRAAKPGQVRTAIGASATLTDHKTITVDDPKKVPIKYLRRPAVLAAIAKEVRADMIRGDKIAGVSMASEAKTVVRK